MVSDMLIIVMIGVRLSVALALLRLGRRPEHRPLIWLALAFAANGLSNIFLTQQIMPNLFLFAIGLLIAQPALVMFTMQTFYQGRPSPWRLFMAASVAGALISIVLLRSGGGFDLLLAGALGAFLTWSWHTWSAWQAMRRLAGERYLEPWVRRRYSFMIVYGLLMMITVLLLPLRGVILQFPPLAALQVLVAIGALLLQYLAWCMPQRLRAYLNRNYQELTQSDDELLLSEEELMRLAAGMNTPANTTAARWS
jgi:hypothetical protein